MAWGDFFTQRWWQTDCSNPLWGLKPVEQLFSALSQKRAFFLKNRQPKMSVPIVVVGNIIVGGAGKTPILIALAKALQKEGWTIGIVSRGFGRQSKGVVEVLPEDSPLKTGDEPLLIRQKTHCPVFVGEKRMAAVEALLKHYPATDVVLSDDGLQHYSMPRWIELAVFDSRGVGNGHLLPRGPLREPLARLNEVDAILLNGVHPETKWLSQLSCDVPVFPVCMQTQAFYALHDSSQKKWAADFVKEQSTLGALTGIGAPLRFLNTLEQLGLKLSYQKIFADHYFFQEQDLAHLPCDVVFLTEKDALKCQNFAQLSNNIWILPIQAQLPQPFVENLVEKLRGF